MINIDKTKEDLCDKLDIVYSELVNTEEQVTIARSKLFKLQTIIDKKDEVIVQLDILEQKAKRLKENNLKTEEEIADKRKEYNNLVKDLKSLVKVQNAKLRKIELDYNLLKDKNNHEIERAIPKVIELTNREQALAQREKDVSVLERRYQKLFKVLGKKL